MTMVIEEEDNVDKHHPGTGLVLPLPILMKEDNDIMLNDIEWMVESVPAIEGQGRGPQQVREELEELDEIVQEITRGRDP
jgi:hypothetical protein